METHIYLPSNSVTICNVNRESVKKYVFYSRVFGEENVVANIGTEERGNKDRKRP
jgi:hypothetical protein